MNVYELDITFKASPKSTFFTRELGLPGDVVRRLKEKLA